MTQPASPAVEKCVNCGRTVEVCYACDEPGCKACLCYWCLVLALRQTLPRVHTHGG